MNHEIMRGNNYAAQICIDKYDSKILCGRLQSAALDSEMSFSSLMEFFCEMEQLLEAAARKRGFLISGGEVNTERMAHVLLDEFREGKLGRMTLERP